MRYWYDAEFLENGRTIDLISIGIVAEDDRELYLVNEKAGRGKLQRRIRRHPWLMNNVVPNLPLGEGSKQDLGGWWGFDEDSPAIVSLDHIRRAVRQFIRPSQVELWAWCGAYDHVALMQLFGLMAEKPSWFPSYTHDFQQLLDEHGILDDQLPTQAEGQHNALADAKHLRFMMSQLDSHRGGLQQYKATITLDELAQQRSVL